MPELELPYMNSSPEEMNMDMAKEHHPAHHHHNNVHLGGGGNGGGVGSGTASVSLHTIPTIHIPEFEPKLGPNEISTEALQALLFN